MYLKKKINNNTVINVQFSLLTGKTNVKLSKHLRIVLFFGYEGFWFTDIEWISLIWCFTIHLFSYAEYLLWIDDYWIFKHSLIRITISLYDQPIIKCSLHQLKHLFFLVLIFIFYKMVGNFNFSFYFKFSFLKIPVMLSLFMFMSCLYHAVWVHECNMLGLWWFGFHS